MKALKLLALVFPLLLVGTAWAQHITSKVDVACPTAAATAIGASSLDSFGQPNRLCVSIDDTDATNAVRIGGSNVDATHGSKITAGSSKTYCVVDALYCFGVGGTVTITVTESTR